MRLLLLMPLMLAAACARTPTAGEAICDGIAPAARAHALALADSPDDAAVLTGQALLSRMAAACGR